MEFPPLVGQVLRRRVRRLRVEPHTTSPEPPGIGDKLSVDGQVVISRRVLSGRFEPPRVVLGVHVDRLPAPGVHLRTSSAQLLQWMKWGEAEVGEALPWIRPGGCNSLCRTTCRLLGPSPTWGPCPAPASATPGLNALTLPFAWPRLARPQLACPQLKPFI